MKNTDSILTSNNQDIITNKISQIVNEVALKTGIPKEAFIEAIDNNFPKELKPTSIESSNIKGITLLSAEEYEQFKNNIPSLNHSWWLRSPGDNGYAKYVQGYAKYVQRGGYVDKYGAPISYQYVAVRPALILNSESSRLKIKDEFKFGKQKWTVISDTYAICNDNIGERCFRAGCRADWEVEDANGENANDYEKSDVKEFIEDWLESCINKEMSLMERAQRGDSLSADILEDHYGMDIGHSGYEDEEEKKNMGLMRETSEPHNKNPRIHDMDRER